MQRVPTTFTIRNLQHEFPRIEFPEYQREPTVWSRDQKQRLMDSILRGFDIAPIYLYERDDEAWECIDGRQRLNAIMSFLGVNDADDDNQFALKIHNEVADEAPGELFRLNGVKFDALEVDDREAILDYEVITVILSGSREPDEFNLQFLRLNLGTLINAGEKLHAMVGVMRDRLFGEHGLGKHLFLDRVGVPTRRYAREVIATQLMLQASFYAQHNEFTRGRHFDLQKYLKLYADHEDPRLPQISQTLDALEANAPAVGDALGNRAICVSVILAAWALDVRDKPELATQFGEFVATFLRRLAEQVERMKEFDIDHRYDYLVEFQKNLTQAAVEKPAIEYRHRMLTREFAVWRETGCLTGDDAGDGGDAV